MDAIRTAGQDRSTGSAAARVPGRAGRDTRWVAGSRRLLLHIVLIVLGITFLMPLLWVASTSLKAPGQVFEVPVDWIPNQPRWSNYGEVFTRLPFATFIVNTLVVTVLGTVGSVLSAITAAYALARLGWAGRRLIFGAMLATMMLPPVVTLVPMFVIFKQLHLIDTFYPLWLPAWFAPAFYVFLLRQYMMTIPKEFDEAAKVDGASNFRILWQVIVPQCRPAVATVAIFAGLSHYNDFMGPLIYLSQNEKYTVPLGLMWFQGRFGQFWHLVMAATMITIIPLLVLFLLAQKHFVRGITLTGLAGR
jgi:multiple sugar transport system permease protein